MEYKELSPKAKISWRIGRIILSVIIIGISGPAVFILAPKVEFDRYLYIGFVVIALYCVATTILYPIIEYRQWKYAITEDKIVIRHGIFYITQTVIPIIRMQHITITQGPINRILGLFKITITLASGSFHIEGLTKEVSDTISENLKNKLYTRLEVNDKEKVGKTV